MNLESFLFYTEYEIVIFRLTTISSRSEKIKVTENHFAPFQLSKANRKAHSSDMLQWEDLPAEFQTVTLVPQPRAAPGLPLSVAFCFTLKDI